MSLERLEKIFNIAGSIGTVFGALAAISVPVMITLLGIEHNDRLALSEVQQRNFQNTSELIKLLSSKNPDERKNGYLFAQHVVEKKLVDSTTRQIISEIYTEAKDAEQDSLNKKISSESYTTVANEIVPRVYFHITYEYQRDSAESVAKRLMESSARDFENAIIVPGIELKPINSNRNRLRYFRNEEKPDVDKISDLLLSLGIDNLSENLSKRYSDAKIRARHYELWFGRDFLILTVFRDLINPVLLNLEESKSVNTLYERSDFKYEYARKLYELNSRTLRVINENNDLIPRELEIEFLSIKNHLNDWVDNYDKNIGNREFGDYERFETHSTDNFPSNSVSKIEAFKKTKN